MRKLDFCLSENKDADQLHSKCNVDQRFSFHYTDNTIPLLSSNISSFHLSSTVVQAGLCRTWSETTKTGFLTLGLIYAISIAGQCLSF